MTPYIIGDDYIQEVPWKLIDYHDEETGETHWELCAAVVRFDKETGKRWTVPMGIPKVEADSMLAESLEDLKNDMIKDAIKLLEEAGYGEADPVKARIRQRMITIGEMTRHKKHPK